MNWHLLIHQIPAKPSYFRAKIWRRLQKIGAVPIKQAVYVMPCTDRSREDLGWVAKEIIESGGDAVLVEATFLEGLSDEQVVELFASARQADYEKLLHEISALSADWHLSAGNEIAALECNSTLRKLRKTYTDIQKIDFFSGPGQAQVEASLASLETNLRGAKNLYQDKPDHAKVLKGKTWVTRTNIYVDRMASAWFIRSFIDKEATFKFVPGNRYQPQENELRFDMMEAEFTHINEQCTFEVLAEIFTENDKALGRIAQIIHDIDVNDDAFGLEETAGIKALFDGIVAAEQSDAKRIERASALLNDLYAYCCHSNI